jgi:hypothetical protein
VDGARGPAQLRVLLVRLRDALEKLKGVALGGPVLQADHGEPTHGRVRVARGELVEQRAERIDVAGMRAGEALERDERGASRGRAVVLEPPTQELELLTEPKLGDRPVALRAGPVVGVADGRLDLLVPLRAKLRERTLLACVRKSVRLGSRLGEGHETDEIARGPGPV